MVSPRDWRSLLQRVTDPDRTGPLARTVAIILGQPLHDALQQVLAYLQVPHAGKPAAEPQGLHEGDVANVAAALQARCDGVDAAPQPNGSRKEQRDPAAAGFHLRLQVGEGADIPG